MRKYKPKKPKRVIHPELRRKPWSQRNHSLVTTEPEGHGFSQMSSFQLDQAGVGKTSQTSRTQSFLHFGNNIRNGVANPRWKDQTRLGQNATTSFSGDKWDLRGSNFYSAYAVGSSTNVVTRQVQKVWAYQQSGRHFFPALPDTSDPPPQVIAPVHNRCIAKFLQEVTAARSSENLTGRSIKHFKHDVHSTIHPMAGIQEKIKSYLTSLEKVKYGKLKGPSLLDTIGSAYLEFKFGVEPFVTDISDIIADMVIRDRKRNPSVEVEATAHSIWSGDVNSYTDNSASSGLMGAAGFGLTYNVRRTGVYSERIKGAVRTGINDMGRLGIIQDNRLLPSDWAPTIFSILPYAWMINYFTNIREIIDGASLRFSDLVWACSTARNEVKALYQGPFISNQNPFNVGPSLSYSFSAEAYGSNPTLVFTRVSRFAVTPSSLVPSFEWKIPTTTVPWANMMAAFLPRILKIVF